jgi:hypothetical protein
MHPMARRKLAAVAGFIVLGAVAISAQSPTPDSRPARAGSPAAVAAEAVSTAKWRNTATTVPQTASVPGGQSRTVYLTVVDQNGGLVRGLQAVDVEVREGGKPRAVKRLEVATEAPEITIIADLFDRVDTEQLWVALDEFVAEAPADSRIGIMTVEGAPPAPAAYSSNREVVKTAIARLSPLSEMQLQHRHRSNDPMSVGGERNVERVGRTVSALLSAVSQRPAVPRVFVLVASEESLSGSGLYNGDFKAARDLAVRFDVVRVHADLRPGRPPSVEYVDVPMDILLTKGTRATGGRDALASSTRDIGRELCVIAEELRSRYLVEFSHDPEVDAGRLEVAVRRPRMSVRITPGIERLRPRQPEGES